MSTFGRKTLLKGFQAVDANLRSHLLPKVLNRLRHLPSAQSKMLKSKVVRASEPPRRPFQPKVLNLGVRGMSILAHTPSLKLP